MESSEIWTIVAICIFLAITWMLQGDDDDAALDDDTSVQKPTSNINEGTIVLHFEEDNSLQIVENDLDYVPFTTQFDRILFASDLIDQSEKQLSPIAFPTITESQRLECPVQYGHRPLITILLDNSNSLQDQSVTWLIEAAAITGLALESSGIDFEILGFTTSEWSGGQSRQHWLSQGRPPNPGRLNDLLHVVYHSALEPSENWVNSLRLMLKDGFRKENIDGEALSWAYERANKFDPSFWLCILVSDGTPADDSTLIEDEIYHFFKKSPVPRSLLLDHLAIVLGQLDQKPNVQLAVMTLDLPYLLDRPDDRVRVSPTTHPPEVLLQFIKELLMKPSH